MPPSFSVAGLRASVYNRGTPPDSFLTELITWGRTAPLVLFSPNPNPADYYASVRLTLGPWTSDLHRRAAMLEGMRVLGGFESKWNWTEGGDTTNPESQTPETMEAGLWQVSADSMAFGQDLKDIVKANAGSMGGLAFQREMKANHPFAMTYIAMLLRHTVRHNGPIRDGLIHKWLRKAAVNEFMQHLG